MGAEIVDEFSVRRDVSKQRRRQLRHKRDGLCLLCPEPAANGSHCARHAVNVREEQRRRQGCGRRNWLAQSYGFEFAR